MTTPREPWPKPKSRPRGLGDLVAIVAQPLANLADGLLGTRISECGGCKARQKKLNQIMPFSSSPDDKPLS